MKTFIFSSVILLALLFTSKAYSQTEWIDFTLNNTGDKLHIVENHSTGMDMVIMIEVIGLGNVTLKGTQPEIKKIKESDGIRAYIVTVPGASVVGLEAGNKVTGRYQILQFLR